MSRLRMEWDWVGEYPIFVYMRFYNHNLWHVKVVKGEKNNQNAPGSGPEALAWFKYTSQKCSRSEVCREACAKVKEQLKGKI